MLLLCASSVVLAVEYREVDQGMRAQALEALRQIPGLPGRDILGQSMAVPGSADTRRTVVPFELYNFYTVIRDANGQLQVHCTDHPGADGMHQHAPVVVER